MQPLKKRQSAIDQHFKRSIKLKSGDFVQIIPTEIMKDASLQLSCAFPGCSKKCANRGALANHVNFAHTARGWTQFPDMWSLSQKNLASLFNLWLSLRWRCMWYPVLLGWLLCHSSIPYFDLLLHLSAPKTKFFSKSLQTPQNEGFSKYNRVLQSFWVWKKLWLTNIWSRGSKGKEFVLDGLKNSKEICKRTNIWRLNHKWLMLHTLL